MPRRAFESAMYHEAIALDALDASIAELRSKAKEYVKAMPPRIVIVVDDEQAMTTVLDKALTSYLREVEVIPLHSLAAARAWLAEHGAPRVAIVDMRLPDGRGWDFAAELPRGVQVILMSGAIDADLLSGLSAATSALACVEKPVDLDTIVALVAEALGEPAPARAL
ncbi:MAG TPA: response regulator [Polyangiaceae bacterium]